MKFQENRARSARLEPTTTIRDPPAHKTYRNRGDQCPPQRQEKIGGHAQDEKECPEDLFLHTYILARRDSGSRVPLALVTEEISGRAHAL